MPVRIVAQHEVEALLPMAECVDVLADALRALARDDAVLPLRSLMWMPDRTGLLGLMPAYLGSPRCLGLKVITVMPGNHGTGLDTHQGAVLLFDAEHGSLLAIVDASSVTAIRTAAASGLATRLLAREDAGDLAILGSGVQAASHLQAMRTVRSLRRVRVWSRNQENATRFSQREGQKTGLLLEVCASAREAVEGADLICTTTAAREPVLLGKWIAPGTHVNAVGACLPSARELDTEAVVRARLFVDRRESALHEAGDFLLARAEGAIGDDHLLGELGDVLLGRLPGRTAPEDVTLFESLGIGVWDLAAAHAIYRKAEATGTGLPVELGGRR